MESNRVDSSLEVLIKERIRADGPVTFAHFMETVLYHPAGGYYVSSREKIGGRGDFYTSPLAHPAFGALIAIQLEEMWTKIKRPVQFWVVELGSGKGRLAADILNYAHHLDPAFGKAIEYIAVEIVETTVPSQWHQVTSTSLPLRGVVGCILSNEFFDALPFHRVVQTDGGLQEVYVGLGNDRFIEFLGDPSTTKLMERLQNLGLTLEVGQEAEINLGLEPRMKELSQALDRGYILTIDYGYPAQVLYAPTRRRGTWVCHYRHTINQEPYRRIGRQDITANVDFTTLTSSGEKYGLTTCGLVPQRQFLANLGIQTFMNGLRRLGLSQLDYETNLMGIRELIRPEGLGRFGVLVQSKGGMPVRLCGLGGPKESLINNRRLPVPLLTDYHLDLLKGRYPHLAHN